MNETFVFAETAFHHEGDVDYLNELIDAAADSGVNGIKFQVLINFDELISGFHPAYGTLRNYVFSEKIWMGAIERAASKGLKVVIMPLDSAAFALVNKLKATIKFLELHSVSFNDDVVKNSIREAGIDLILSVGGRTKDEIGEAFHFFGDQLKVLMVGFQAFPSRIEDIRLRKISMLKNAYPHCAIGYADHSSFDDPWAIESNSIAYTLGASVFEKHLTLNEGVKRVDFESAIGVEKLRLITKNLGDLGLILHSYEDTFDMTSAEINYRNRQKMAVASEPLGKGTVLRREHVMLKMVGRFDGYSTVDDVIGRTISVDISKDELIRPEHVIN